MANGFNGNIFRSVYANPQAPKFKPGDIVFCHGYSQLFTVLNVNTSANVPEYLYYLEDKGHLQMSAYESTLYLSSPSNVATTTTKVPIKKVKKVNKASSKPKVPAKAIVAFETVVLEDEKKQQILEALEQINQADLIFNDWGFSETIEKGKGVSLLFYGPPGTGKTLMAQAIANQLNRKLNILATADIHSSVPGEAERTIREHFKTAAKNNTILLFDECDSLIYSRSSVGPIVGAQINELLTQLERFDGVTIFTTNRLGTLDEAVNRRLALKLEFAMPNREMRAEIWKRMFPKKAPLANDIDFHKLAVVEVPGGYIKNAVLRAARMAAAEPTAKRQKKIAMRHLVKAIKTEAESMIAFDQAREEETSGIGRVGLDEYGQRIIRTIRSNQ